MFSVKTNDGSPLNEITENKVPIIARDKFEDIQVSIDGGDYFGDTSSEIYFGTDYS